MGCSAGKEARFGEPVNQTSCGNGSIFVGSRVRTQWCRAEGGNDCWYNGTVTKVFTNAASIRYDDGDRWTGESSCIFRLDAPAPHAPQYGAPQYGAQPNCAPQYGAPQYGAPQYGAGQIPVTTATPVGSEPAIPTAVPIATAVAQPLAYGGSTYDR